MNYRSFYQPLKQVAAWTVVSAVLFSAALVSAADGGEPSVSDLFIPDPPAMPSGPSAGAPVATAAEHSPPEEWEPEAQIPEVETASGEATDANAVAVDPSTIFAADAPPAANVVDLDTLPITIVNPDAPAQVHDQGYIDDVDPMLSDDISDTTSDDAGDGAPQEFPQPNGGITVSNFEGIGPTGSFPPDTEIAHGTRWVVEGVNRGFAVYDMRGNITTAYTSYSSLFASALPSGWGGSLFDPRVIYDRTSGKFIQLVIGVDFTAQRSYTFLAISNTSNPNGSWITWRITNNQGAATAWMDYVTLGVDENGIYFSGNLFNFAGGYLRTDLYIYPVNLLTGTSVGGWRFSNLQWPASAGGGAAFSLQAADPHIVNSQDRAFLVNTYSGSGSRVLLWTVSGNRVAGGAAPSLTRAAITVSSYHAIGNNVDQPGTATDIDGGDSRVQNAIYANRRVWTALTTADSAGATNRSGAKVMSVNTDTNALDWQRTQRGGIGSFVFYPAITVRGSSISGPVGIYHNYSTATTHASSTYKVWDDPEDGVFTGTWQIYKSGEGPYTRVFSGRNRFGDYSGADYDFTCPGRMWGATEYADSGNRWATRIHGAMMDGSAPCPLGPPLAGGLTLTTPANSSTSTDTTPTYRWTRDVDATTYQLYSYNQTTSALNYWTTYTSAALGCVASGPCSITPATVLTPGVHRWWVRAINTYGVGSWVGPNQWIISSTAGSTAPILTGPTGIVVDQTPTLTWTGGPSDTFYYLNMWGPAGNEHLGWVSAAAASCVGADTSCSYTPPSYLTGESFLYHGRHYVYMLAYNGNFPLSPYAGPMVFDVSAATVPGATTTLTPSGAGGDNTPTYRWNAHPTATAYLLYVVNGGGQIILSWYSHSAAGCAPGTGVCAITPATPVPSGSATWYVKTYNPQGQGAWSSGRTFSVP